MLGLADLGALAEGAVGPGEGADDDAVELVGAVGPGGCADVLADAGEQEGEPSEDDVGADPLLFAVVDRLQVDDLLEVPPAAIDFQELLVAQGDVLGGHRRVGGAQEVLAVEVLLGLGLGGVDAEQSAGGDAEVAVQARLGGEDAA